MQADLVKRHKHLSFLFYKLYHYLPLANQVQGAFAELEGLRDAFYDIKEKSGVMTPNLDLLVQESEAKYKKSKS
jgi:2-dehydropantoate 2-reductase